MAQLKAVEWYAEKSYSITLDFLKKKLNESEFLVQQTATLVKAQQMEKEQIMNDYKHGQNNGYMYRDGASNIITAEQYYNEAYGNNTSNTQP